MKKNFVSLIGSIGRNCSTSVQGSAQLTLPQIRARRNELFAAEKARQLGLVSRVEKIEVHYKGPPENCMLLMNKNLSTPFNAAMHIQELLMTRSVIALVNGQPWDLHRPLNADCEISFQHFQNDDPKLANKAFWRSCSFLLGYVLETAFKDQHHVELCSFPPPIVQSGSFVYDADIQIKDWKPSLAELNCLSRLAVQLQQEDKKFEPLDVDASVALDIFKHNRFKSAQIPHIAAQSPSQNTVTLYRMADHVDITKGPLVSHTGLFNRFTVTSFHPIESPEFGPLTRVQGLAVPKQLPIHYWNYEFLCERAGTFNNAPLPRLYKSPSTPQSETNSLT